MKWIGSFLYVVAFVLLLEVIKRLILKGSASGTFFTGTIIICVQFLAVISFFLLLLFYKICSRYHVRRKWLLSFTGVISVFIATELILGSLLNHPQYIPSWLKWSFQFYYDSYDCRMIQFREDAAVYDPQLFYTLKPQSAFHYTNREFNTVFYTNSRGTRDDEASLQSPEIICLGDSYAMGWGVQQQETYAQYLERVSGMKVLNAAISSYGTVREMKLLKQFDTTRLKYVIIQYCGNDIQENESFIENQQALSISSRSYYDSIVAGHKLIVSYFPGKYSLLIGQVFLKHQLNKILPVFKLFFGREEPFGSDKSHAAAFLKVLYSANLNCKKVKVIVIVLDSYLHKHNSFLKAVERQAQLMPYKDYFKGNLFVVDGLTGLGQSDFFDLDLHIKAKAHEKIGQKLWDVIREK